MSIKRYCFIVLVSSVSLALSPAGYADDIEERKSILKKVDEILADKAALKLAMEKGKERIQFCSNCHGMDGNSTRPDIPNLASQNPAYMVEQFQHFQTGVRKNFVMQTLARQFTFRDKVNISIYFSNQQLKPIEADASTAKSGENIFQSTCLRCHGANGRGEEGYARVAGQKPLYVVNTLKRFRSNALNVNPGPDTKRSNILMEQVTARLTDEEIDSLASYIALLK
jgi:cytochrome c553